MGDSAAVNDAQTMQRPGLPASQQQILKVAVASIIGSVIEQYDFLVTGIIAATVWGDVFKLPGLPPPPQPRSASTGLGS